MLKRKDRDQILVSSEKMQEERKTKIMHLEVHIALSFYFGECEWTLSVVETRPFKHGSLSEEPAEFQQHCTD